MRVLQVGNFGAPHSTENELRKALLACGHEVTALQENQPGAFTSATRAVADHSMVLWTRTGWNPPIPHDTQLEFLTAAADAGVPTVGYHLDRWWGLNREGQVLEEPFFRCSLVVTADGGHDAEWADAGVHHRWLPPAVSSFECNPGLVKGRYQSDIAFVGSWRPGYHAEWTHRPELVEHLQRTYGPRCRFWPQAGKPAIRGQALRDLYASAKILVGDSCLAGNATRYWSDRIPETIGRGGFLIHPWVEGIDEHYSPGEHLLCWPLGDWDELDRQIRWALDHPDERRAIAVAGREHVLEHHTYTRRMEELAQLVSVAA